MMLKRGMNEVLVHGLVEMGMSGRTGKVYEDYYKHRPVRMPGVHRHETERRKSLRQGFVLAAMI